MPSLGAGQSPCPTGGFQGGFGPISGDFGRGQNGAPGEAQRLRSRWRLCCLTDAAYSLRVSGFAGERRSSGMSEFSPLRGGNEGEGELLRRSKRSRPGAYGACDDEERGGNEGEGELLRRSKRSRPGAYGACDDEEQEKALALLWRLGGHFRPQCGRFQGLELALF